MSLEYNRKTGGPLAGAPASAGDAPERTLDFGTVTFAADGAKSAGNVAEQLLIRGLATVTKHRRCARLSLLGTHLPCAWRVWPCQLQMQVPSCNVN